MCEGSVDCSSGPAELLILALSLLAPRVTVIVEFRLTMDRNFPVHLFLIKTHEWHPKIPVTNDSCNIAPLKESGMQKVTS